MWVQYLATVILSSFFMFATPELVKVDTAIALINNVQVQRTQPRLNDVQSQTTPLSKYLTVLHEKLQKVDAETQCRINKNAELDLKIAEKIRERDEVDKKLVYSRNSVKEYSQKVEELQKKISEIPAEIKDLETKKPEFSGSDVLDIIVSVVTPIHAFVADINARIRDLQDKIISYETEVESAKKELSSNQSKLTENQKTYDDLSEEKSRLEKIGGNLTRDMKTGKKLLSDLNSLSRDLQIAIDPSEELQEASISRRKPSQRRLEQIAQLSKEAQDIIGRTDTFLRNNSCVNPVRRSDNYINIHSNSIEPTYRNNLFPSDSLESTYYE